MGFFTRSLKDSSTPKTIEELLQIEDVKNGIIIRNGQVPYKYILLLEIAPINFKLKSEDEQSFILNTYGELLKVIKCPIQITLLSRKADTTPHMTYMQKQSEHSSQELKLHMDEYLQFFKSVSGKSAVSRRFFLSIPYGTPAGIKSEQIDFNQAVDTLYKQKGRVKHWLEKAGSGLVEHENEEYFVWDVLYQLLNRKSSEIQSLPHLNRVFTGD